MMAMLRMSLRRMKDLGGQRVSEGMQPAQEDSRQHRGQTRKQRALRSAVGSAAVERGREQIERQVVAKDRRWRAKTMHGDAVSRMLLCGNRSRSRHQTPILTRRGAATTVCLAPVRNSSELRAFIDTLRSHALGHVWSPGFSQSRTARRTCADKSARWRSPATPRSTRPCCSWPASRTCGPA